MAQNEKLNIIAMLDYVCDDGYCFLISLNRALARGEHVVLVFGHDNEEALAKVSKEQAEVLCAIADIAQQTEAVALNHRLRAADSYVRLVISKAYDVPDVIEGFCKKIATDVFRVSLEETNIVVDTSHYELEAFRRLAAATLTDAILSDIDGSDGSSNDPDDKLETNASDKANDPNPEMTPRPVDGQPA